MTGSCQCGAVHIHIEAGALRTGICHCLECRKHLGALFKAFAVVPQAAVTVTGETRSWGGSSAGDERHFCPTCGSPLFSLIGEGELQLMVGCLDAPDSAPPPTFETWTKRREAWLPDFHLKKYLTDRR
jgi:hypothetical protein